MQNFQKRILLFTLLLLFIFPIENFAQTKIGLLPIKISYDKDDNKSIKELKAELDAKLEEIKNRKPSDEKEKVNDGDEKDDYVEEEIAKAKALNEYEKQFSIMLTENLMTYLAKDKIELTEINVDEMTKEEKTGEKEFYNNASLNIIADIAKTANKFKLKKAEVSALENDKPSEFIQTIAKKYDKQFIIYLSAVGKYERTVKNKNYRVNNTDLKGTLGWLDVKVLIFEKTEGKMIYINRHKFAHNDTIFIRDKDFEKFGKKVAKQIKKAIE